MRSEFWKNHFSDNKTGSERQSLEEGDPLGGRCEGSREWGCGQGPPLWGRGGWARAYVLQE